MSNPGHNNTFNKDAEDVARQEQQGLKGLMNTSVEWDHAAEEDRRLAERDPDEPVKPVIAGGVTATKAKVGKLLAPQPSAPADGPTYRQETEVNDDGSQNVNWPKE